MKTTIIIWLSIICLGLTVHAQEAEKTDNPTAIEKEFPLSGNWQIISYQVIGYPEMNTAEIKAWINRVIKFNTNMVIMYEKGTMKVCPISESQVVQKDAEGYFLIGYKVKPHRLGVINKEIQVITLTCATESWFGKTQEFVILSDELMLIYWDGVLFYLVKRMANQQKISKVTGKLFVMPQSVGTLMPDTVFSQEVLATTFPNYQIELLTHITEDKKQVLSHFELYLQKELKLAVYPNPNTMTIDQIKIFDEQAVMPGKTQLGDLFQDIFSDISEIIDCQAGIKERQGQTVCSFLDMEMIQYVFEPKNKINGQLVSPVEALNQAKLVEVIWKANSGLITSDTHRSFSTSDNLAHSAENSHIQIATTTVLLDVESAYKIQEKQLNELSHQLTILLEKPQPELARITEPTETEVSSQTTTKPDLSKLLTVFQTAQAAWLRYRDDNCQWRSTLVTNQSEKANKTFTCLEKITAERIKEIEAIFEDLKTRINGG
jgi:uncharacterized protein YecT (DUF1311 family)